MQTIGIVGGGFKPLTKGHFFLIEKASEENESVFLFVSNKNRIRKGEIPLYFDSHMKILWEKYYEKIIPHNVKMTFVPNPTTSVYNLLDSYCNRENDVAFTLYGDNCDLEKNFPDKKMEKYFPHMYHRSLISKRSFVRADNMNISGSEMRKYIAENDIKNFIYGLPVPVREHGKRIYNILKSC